MSPKYEPASEPLQISVCEVEHHQDLIAASIYDLGGVSREQKMLKGHLPRVIYHQVY